MSTNAKANPAKRRTLAAVALLIAVGTAGCTSRNEPAVATAVSGAPTAGVQASPAAAGQDPALKFSQCMREQGLTWFPDPGADGGLKVSVPEGTDQARVTKAEQACQAYAPGANQNGTRLGDEDLTKLRRMSQCIRDHGFPKYPDPDPFGGVRIDSASAGFDPEDPAFRKARQDCEKYLPPRRNGGNS